MKKLIAAVLIATMLVGCGHPLVIEEKAPDGKYSHKEYPTYGFFNEGTQKSEKICYEVSVGNVVWSIILMETVFAPIYFIGFSLFNPVGHKVNGKCGIDKN